MAPIGTTWKKCNMTILKRFSKKYVIDPNTKCWLWIGWKNSKGYGGFHLNNKDVGAHRVSYKLFKKDFDETLFVLHKCDNSSCVNPDHLFLGTQQDNMVDKKTKGRSPKKECHYRWAGDSASPNTLASRKYRNKLKLKEIV